VVCHLIEDKFIFGERYSRKINFQKFFVCFTISGAMKYSINVIKYVFWSEEVVVFDLTPLPLS
jgi:hypothetical protein